MFIGNSPDERELAGEEIGRSWFKKVARQLVRPAAAIALVPAGINYGIQSIRGKKYRKSAGRSIELTAQKAFGK